MVAYRRIAHSSPSSHVYYNSRGSDHWSPPVLRKQNKTRPTCERRTTNGRVIRRNTHTTVAFSNGLKRPTIFGCFVEAQQNQSTAAVASTSNPYNKVVQR